MHHKNRHTHTHQVLFVSLCSAVLLINTEALACKDWSSLSWLWNTPISHILHLLLSLSLSEDENPTTAANDHWPRIMTYTCFNFSTLHFSDFSYSFAFISFRFLRIENEQTITYTVKIPINKILQEQKHWSWTNILAWVYLRRYSSIHFPSA